ncbi:hypothetical protein BJY04DRAFT_189633 [Aspergillus karnatakaensis]|uniref:uncharacterized protein n=1 Tax=Aspergillus karnatakaensis TaxID=1810916 RepID=UPI003CCDEFD9
MRFILLITALMGVASAQKLASGKPCKADGSLGICESGLCVQLPNADQGTCK